MGNDGRPREPLPMTTPIPGETERQIRELVAEIADLLPGLDDDGREMLRGVLAYRALTFKRTDPHG